MAEFSPIEFEIRGNADDAKKSLLAFSKALEKVAQLNGSKLSKVAVGLRELKEAAKGGGRSFASLAEGLGKLVTAANSAGATATKLTKLSRALGGIRDIGKVSIPKSIGDGIRNISSAVDDISSETFNKLDKLTSYLSRLSGVDLRGFSSAVKKAAKESGSKNALVPGSKNALVPANAPTDKELLDQLLGSGALGDKPIGGSPLQQYLPALGSVMKDIGKNAVDGLKAFWDVAKKAGGALKDLGKRVVVKINDATVGRLKEKLGAVQTLFRSIGRIAFYRMIRAGIKMVTQAFSEGIKNLYGWSKAFGGATMSGKTFADTMDDLATSSLYLKNSIGAAAAPFISALAPAIDFIIDKAVALINVLNQLFALLGGATSWNRAIRKADEYGDAVGGAGGAAKEALRYLAPFDELNVLPDDRKGGGGGGAGTDYSDMFEETTEFAEGIADFVQNIKDAISKQDWAGLGALLGSKVNELVDWMDNNNVFKDAGAKVGGFINAWFTTRYWTLDTINFQKIGEKIADFLNEALGKIDANTMGRYIAQKFTIIPDVVIGFIKQTDWNKVGEKIGSFVRGIFDEWSSWLGGIDWDELGSDIATKLGDAIKGLNTDSTAQSIKTFLSKAFNAAVGLLTGFMKTLFTGGTFSASSDMDLDISINTVDFADGTNGTVVKWRDVIARALPALGTAIGFKAGGIKGAIFGATIGLGIEAAVEAVDFFESWKNGTPDDTLLANAIVDALPALAAAIGLIVGGPGGALLGATLGIGLWFAIKTIDWSFDPTGNEGGGQMLGGSVQELQQYANDYRDKIQEALDAEGLNVSIEVDEIVIPDDADVVDQINDAAASGGLNQGRVIGGFHAKVNQLMDNINKDKKIIQHGSINVDDYSPNFPKSQSGSHRTTSKGFPFVDGALYLTSYAPHFEDGSKRVTSKKAPFVDGALYLNGYGLHFDESGKRTTRGGDPFVDGSLYLKGYGLHFDEGNKPTTSKGAPLVDAWTKFVGYQNNLDTPNIGVNANIVSRTVLESLKKNGSLNVGVNADIISTSGTPTIAVGMNQATGGAYYGGAWHDIPQYASGGRPHGSLFLAGEAGAELVGHVGGRTEVLNRSQIASSIYSAVRGAMLSVNGASSSEDSEEILYRAFRRALDETDFGGDVEIDGDVLYRHVVNKNKAMKKAYGFNPMLTA